MKLEGRTAIVTGAGSGIGRAATKLFAAEGATVVAVDLDEAAAEETLAGVDGSHRVVAGDVADPALWDRAVGGGIDVAYLNAGLYGFSGPIDEVPVDLYRRTVAANIDGVVLGVRALVPGMRERSGGAIVVTASVAGIIAFEGNPIYTLTKQAVTGFVRALAPSLIADGITIDAVCPGIVDTPMTTAAAAGSGWDPKRIPLIPAATIAAEALDLATSDGTGRCRAVRRDGDVVDWEFPGWPELASASGVRSTSPG